VRVHTTDRIIESRTAILAADPESENAWLGTKIGSGKKLRAACLDVALDRLPEPGVAAAAQAQAQRVQVESFVRLDPVVVQAPPSIQVNVTGQINGPVNGSGTIPLSTNAPRGQASSSPVAPPVSK
jgi:hypothetical protein